MTDRKESLRRQAEAMGMSVSQMMRLRSLRADHSTAGWAHMKKTNPDRFKALSAKGGQHGSDKGTQTQTTEDESGS